MPSNGSLTRVDPLRKATAKSSATLRAIMDRGITLSAPTQRATRAAESADACEVLATLAWRMPAPSWRNVSSIEKRGYPSISLAAESLRFMADAVRSFAFPLDGSCAAS